MVCKCPCGGEYGFEPMGFWICHRCGAVNDSGPLGGKKDDVVAADRTDELVWEGREFAARADASVRAHPGSWESWYSLGAAYGARGNVLEAGLMWTRASKLLPQDGLSGFIDRCAVQMSECIFRGVVAGDRCNIPYAKGLEHACIEKGLGRSFCSEVHGRVLGRLTGLMPHEAFSLINIASAVMMQGISLRPDIRDHRDILEGMIEAYGRPVGSKTISPMKKAANRRIAEYLSSQADACRIAVEAIGSSLEGRGDIDGLVAAQPSDGSAGFADMLSKAVSRGSEAAYMRATKASEDEISKAESEMREYIGRYVLMFMQKDASAIPENRVYTG